MVTTVYEAFLTLIYMSGISRSFSDHGASVLHWRGEV